MANSQKWLRTIAWLRREFPAQHKVRIRSVKMKDYDGEAIFQNQSRYKQFLIRINRNKPLATKLDTLLHEWAHCLTWFGAEQEEHHSDEWGLWYAKIYRAFEKWNFGKE